MGRITLAYNECQCKLLSKTKAQWRDQPPRVFERGRKEIGHPEFIALETLFCAFQAAWVHPPVETDEEGEGRTKRRLRVIDVAVNSEKFHPLAETNSNQHVTISLMDSLIIPLRKPDPHRTQPRAMATLWVHSIESIFALRKPGFHTKLATPG